MVETYILLNALSKEIFYKEFGGAVKGMVHEIKENAKEIFNIAPLVQDPVASCPKCQRSVYENDKAYVCSGCREGCHVTIWKNALETLGKKKIISYEARRLLLGRTIKITLKSRKGNPFQVDMIFNIEKNRIEFTS